MPMTIFLQKRHKRTILSEALGMIMRKCKKCQTEKPIKKFEITNKKYGWRRWECTDCVRKRIQAWGQISKNRIRIQSTKQNYYERNRGKVIDIATKWNKDNPERHNEIALSHYYRLQHQAIMAYGGYVCACCGETEPLFLTIDHINNDGTQHRKTFQSSGDGLYKWLKNHNYPKGFQVLCMNCNFGKRRNGGICPHKGISSKTNKLTKRTCNDHSSMEVELSSSKRTAPRTGDDMICSA